MRYTIVLTVNVYSHADRIFKKINPLSMLSHRLKTQGAYHCQRSAMGNPVSIMRRVKTQFVVFELKSIEGSVPH